MRAPKKLPRIPPCSPPAGRSSTPCARRASRPSAGVSTRTARVGEIRARFAEGTAFRVAGRITAHRDMGKSHFLDLSDLTGRIQIYVGLKNLTPEQAAVFALLDLGDFLGVEGEGFITRTGEPTLRVSRFVPLSKALRPLPDKYHGLVDVEARHRQRYLDLLANEKVARDVPDPFAGAARHPHVFPRARLSGGRDAHDAARRGRRGGGAVQDAPQRAGHRPVPAHRAGALPQAAARRRVTRRCSS